MHDTQDRAGLVRCADERGGIAPAARPALPGGRALAAFALISEVEALIDARLAELRLVIPLLAPWRGRLSGRRVLGARAPSEHGEAGEGGVIRGVTRVDIEFEVEVDATSPGVVSLACRSTVRGRDRQTTRTRIALPAGTPDSGAGGHGPHGAHDAHGAGSADVAQLLGDAGPAAGAANPGAGRLAAVSEWVEDALLVFAGDWFEARRGEARRARRMPAP
ncbi:MAG TPA: hypothetical protein VK824_11230 [Planctomycetota bacterium]|nr:hypothetical protein [Planctomycetota bacterium]